MSTRINLLPLCSTQKLVSRDGYAGAEARIFLPFYDKSNGQYFFNGEVGTFPGTTLPQDQSKTLSGFTKPDDFHKECCKDS